MASLLVRTRANMNSFQLSMKCSVAAVARPDLEMGRTIWKKVRMGLAPSMAADSSISLGMPRKAPRRINRVVGRPRAE